MTSRIFNTNNRFLEISPISHLAFPASNSSFISDYLALILDSLGNNYDHDVRKRFNMPPEPYRIDYEIYNDDFSLINHALDFVSKKIKEWEWTYHNLADDLSKNMLLNIIAYRALGYRYVRLPLNCDHFWFFLSVIGRQFYKLPSKKATDYNIELKSYDFTESGYDLVIYTDPFGYINEFYYPQYVYRGVNHVISPVQGDIILDCGACFGGTSVFFACKAGSEGKVYSFEFIDQNLDVFEENIAMNPVVKDRITVIKRPLWSESNKVLFISGVGPGASVHNNAEKGGREVLTYTIDDLVLDQGLPKVDFIKMDIEGAEMEALNGARNTIEKFKPKMAISVYHRLSDFYEVPQFLKAINPDYTFYLQHSTPHGDESVIFAC